MNDLAVIKKLYELIEVLGRREVYRYLDEKFNEVRVLKEDLERET